MLLVMDVGNTNTVIGVYQDDRILSDWRIRTEKEATVDEFGILLRNLFQAQGLTLEPGTDLVISCVVPPMSNTLEGFAQRYLKVRPLWVGPGIKTGMPIHYDNPREVGADRIVNAVAAFEQVHGLEAGNHDRHAVARGDGLVLFPAHDGAHVAGADERLHAVGRRFENPRYGGRHEHVRHENREVVEPPAARLVHSHRIRGRRRFKAHGEEDDPAVGVLPREAQRVEGRVDDPDVRATCLQ